MTSTCCLHKRSVAAPAHKRMRREQPQNHHQHCSHREQQRREDMGCSAQGVELPDPRIHRPWISNGVQLNSFSVAAFGSIHNIKYPISCSAASRLRLQIPSATSAPQGGNNSSNPLQPPPHHLQIKRKRANRPRLQHAHHLHPHAARHRLNPPPSKHPPHDKLIKR